MAFSALDDFCGSEFWNKSLTWYAPDPDFTECFEKTVLVWVPCLFLWIFAGLEIHYMKASKRSNIPWNWINQSKVAIAGLLALLSLADLVTAISQSLSQDGELYGVQICSPLIKLTTFILSILLVTYNRKYGIRTSALLFLFWFFMGLFGVVQFQTEIRKAQTTEIPDELYYAHISYLIYYPFVVMMFVLSCLADQPPRESKYGKNLKPHPEQNAGFLSRLLFNWFNPIIWSGFKKPLEFKDLWDMRPEDSSKEVVPEFERCWEETLRKCEGTSPSEQAEFKSNSNHVTFISGKKRKQANVLIPIFKCFGGMFVFGALQKLLQDVFTFVSPQILGLIISFTRSGDYEWKGYLYVALLFGTGTIQTFLMSQYQLRMGLVGMRIRTTLVSAIYRKALKISNAVRKERTVGEIVNLMAVDAQRFIELMQFINMLWSAPIQIVLAVYFLWLELGPSVIAGVTVMVILIPINVVITNKVKFLQVKQMKYKDIRVKHMNEILNGMKVLKLYAWEPSFEDQILKTRTKEIKILKTSAYLHAGTSFIWTFAPFMVSLVTFATYVLIDEKNILDANKAYVSLALFNILRMPMSMLPMMLSNLVQTLVSVRRINKFMNAEELDPNTVTHDSFEVDPIIMENGTFAWEDEPIIKNINIRLKKRTLTAVVGSVGSGKSSLISALLGEMNKLSGRVNTVGKIAYASQIAWIQNATLKDNITFGKQFDKKRYDRVVEACALLQDFDMLPAGDQTEIGEKGINLSGGQKQRISLARAVYSNSDVYFLDDPLSAVDSHVGKHIFEKVIGPNGLLKDKTTILVTHGITFLPQTDGIIVMKDGEISERGTYQELLERKGTFAEFLLQHITEDVVNEEELDELQDQLAGTPIGEEVTRRLSRHRSRVSESHSEASSEHILNGILKRQMSTDSTEKTRSRTSSILDIKTQIPKKGQLVMLEKSETGSVSWAVYKYYFNAIGYAATIITVLLYFGYQGFNVGSNTWLGVWADDNSIVVNNTVDTFKRNLYLSIYGVLGLGQVLTIIIINVLYAKATLDAATKIHKFLLNNVMRLPSAFFDVTPVGRILARFSNDINGIDLRLPWTIQFLLQTGVRVIATISVICFTTPLFIAVIVPIAILYYFIQRVYVATSRQLKRLESVSRSPIYSHFGETVAGVQVIRAYHQQHRFIDESEFRVDTNQVCYYPSIISSGWLGVRLEMIGNVIILFAALFAVLAKDMAPGLVGLSVSYSLQITMSLNMLVRMAADVEANIVAVERLKEYGEVEQEAPWEIPDKKTKPSWPEDGSVEFKDYAVRYRPGLDLVLKGVNFYIKGGEKIGIVGRTGAGKSSLTLALFRIIEGAAGKILIDGVNIAEIGLHNLRSRLTIIPQDAVLFSGVLRMNLDPFDQYTDDDIWKSLELAHLKEFVKGLPSGLQHEISEGGENLSAGQRQLVCLARALLRKTKVLILDEATAAVDLETDDLIQRTIRSEFKSCTVLTIAHRLNTIMDSDRIVVLDRGLIVEFDTPTNLLADTETIFYGMCKDAGLT